MDNRKVEEVLRSIFGMYGTEIVKKQGNFRSAVFDLLSEQDYADERIVLRNAIETDALVPLATADIITAELAENTVQQLQSAHMTAADAEFVVQCIVRSRGGNPDVMMESKNPVQEQRRYEYNGQTSQKPQERRDKGEESIFEAECKRLKKKGKLYLYKDRLVFKQYSEGFECEIYYQNISNIYKIKTKEIIPFLLVPMLSIFFILVLLGIIGLIFATLLILLIPLCVFYAIFFPWLVRICTNTENNLESIESFVFKKKSDRDRVISIIQDRLGVRN